MPRALKKGTVAMLCMILTGLFLFVGCKKDGKKDDPPPEPEYPINISFTEYSLAENCQWTNLAYDNTVIIINSDEILKQYVACTGGGYPEIDFSENSLLLASGATSSNISKITVNNLQQLSRNEYELNMEILLGNATVVEEWTVALIVEKVSEESHIKLNVNEPEYSVWKWTDDRGIILESTFYPSVNKLHIKSTPENSNELGPPYLMLQGDFIVKYCIKDGKMYWTTEDGDFNFDDWYFWMITRLSENEIDMYYGGWMPHYDIASFYFVCQTKFNEI
jgi:hypothetical protein